MLYLRNFIKALKWDVFSKHCRAIYFGLITKYVNYVYFYTLFLQALFLSINAYVIGRVGIILRVFLYHWCMCRIWECGVSGHVASVYKIVIGISLSRCVVLSVRDPVFFCFFLEFMTMVIEFIYRTSERLLQWEFKL